MNLESPRLQVKTESESEIRERIQAELRSFHISEIPNNIVDHLVVLEQRSHFNDDSRMVLLGIKNFLKFIADSDDSFRLTPINKKRLYLATYLADIGKSSSADDKEAQVSVARLFAIENIPPDKINRTVQETLEDKNYFPDGESEIGEMFSGLVKAGIMTNQNTMREFWDKHASWTNELLDKHPLIFDEETRIIAASHHIDRNVNPRGIDIKQVSNELRFSIFLLMAVDKYQALIVRSRNDHTKAVQSLKAILGQYDGDLFMQFIMRTIDQLGANGSLFTKSDTINK